MKTLVPLFLTSLIALQAFAANIDRKLVLFGVEYTFQDQEMVNEKGRNTISTPYKEAKAEAFARNLVARLNLDASVLKIKKTWKPGLFINVPSDGQWVVNAEPVTIEVNTTPRHLDELLSTAAPIYATASAVGLVPYVNPAAERSGMGHIHVGAEVMRENPFFANPRLLRNVMVYLHKHPSLLHGFAEAFDIGLQSNIETYHTPERQAAFQRAVGQFDRWAASVTEKTLAEKGLNKFLEILRRNDSRDIGFFEHYRFINLEHVKDFPYSADATGKLTIEFRNFRPPKDPATAKAFAEMLLAVMEKQSTAGHVEPFRWISSGEYDRFNTGTRVLADWEEARRELGLKIGELDAAINEYADAVQRTSWKPSELPGAEIFLAYSQKGNRGKFYELRLPAHPGDEKPELAVAGKTVELEFVRVNGKFYWIAALNTPELGIEPSDLSSGRAGMKIHRAVRTCPQVFDAAG